MEKKEKKKKNMLFSETGLDSAPSQPGKNSEIAKEARVLAPVRGT